MIFARQYIFGVFFLIFIGESSFSQNCKIPLEFITSSQVKKQRAKEMLVYSGDEKNKSPFMHYYFNASSCPQKLIYFDTYSALSGPVISELSVSKDGTEKIFTKGRLKGEIFTVYEKELEVFNKSGKILKSEKEEIGDIIIKTINSFDPTNYNKINFWSCRIHADSKDTLSLISNVYDLKTKTYLFKTKKNNVWEETENNITTYKNGEFFEEVQFRNGKQTNIYTKKMLDDDKIKAKEIKGEAFEGLNPLPFNDKVHSDTLYTNNDAFAFDTKPEGNKKSKYTVIRYFQSNDKSKIDYIDILTKKNGLIKKRLSQNQTQNLLFEYVFY